MLSQETLLQIFKETKALLEGHFQLSSGLHSPKYVQCARVLQYPQYAAILCHELAHKFKHQHIDVVIGPALGAVVVAQEMGRALNARAIFGEREKGSMKLRRGFEIVRGEKVLAVEDVITTGGSLQEIIELVKKSGGELVAVGALVDRSQGKANFGAPHQTLVQVEADTWPPEKCPLCVKKMPLEKPGSRTT